MSPAAMTQAKEPAAAIMNSTMPDMTADSMAILMKLQPVHLPVDHDTPA